MPNSLIELADSGLNDECITGAVAQSFPSGWCVARGRQRQHCTASLQVQFDSPCYQLHCRINIAALEQHAQGAARIICMGLRGYVKYPQDCCLHLGRDQLVKWLSNGRDTAHIGLCYCGQILWRKELHARLRNTTLATLYVFFMQCTTLQLMTGEDDDQRRRVQPPCYDVLQLVAEDKPLDASQAGSIDALAVYISVAGMKTVVTLNLRTVEQRRASRNYENRGSRGRRSEARARICTKLLFSSSPEFFSGSSRLMLEETLGFVLCSRPVNASGRQR